MKDAVNELIRELRAACTHFTIKIDEHAVDTHQHSIPHYIQYLEKEVFGFDLKISDELLDEMIGNDCIVELHVHYKGAPTHGLQQGAIFYDCDLGRALRRAVESSREEATA